MPVTLSDISVGINDAGYDAIDVDNLLTELRSFDEIAADVVSLRIFGGLSIEEAAFILKTSVATANRRWLNGKAWLSAELTGNPRDAHP